MTYVPAPVFQLATPVSYHVMSKEVDPVAENDAVYEPTDVDYRFCAKVRDKTGVSRGLERVGRHLMG